MVGGVTGVTDDDCSDVVGKLGDLQFCNAGFQSVCPMEAACCALQASRLEAVSSLLNWLLLIDGGGHVSGAVSFTGDSGVSDAGVVDAGRLGG